jgi:hypothetical protein
VGKYVDEIILAINRNKMPERIDTNFYSPTALLAKRLVDSAVSHTHCIISCGDFKLNKFSEQSITK